MIRLRLTRYLLCLVITSLFFAPFFTVFYRLLSSSCACRNTQSSLSNATRYEKYCDQFDQRIRIERRPTLPIQLDRQKPIPYFYSQWRSTSIMPRVLTPCEHAIYMDLLSILIEHVFKKHNIQYMMMAATLLGKTFRVHSDEMNDTLVTFQGVIRVMIYCPGMMILTYAYLFEIVIVYNRSFSANFPLNPIPWF